MPEEPIAAQPPASFAELPIQPTGSGVQDLEIAYEQMRIAEAGEQSSESVQGRQLDDIRHDHDLMPTVDDETTQISAAHPS